MSFYLTWNPCRISKSIASTHIFKSINEPLYWLESIIHNEKMFLQCTFLTYFGSNFKHVVLSRSNELACIPHITGKIWMSTFQPNWNLIIIISEDIDIVQTVDEGLDIQIWQDSINFDPLK